MQKKTVFFLNFFFLLLFKGKEKLKKMKKAFPGKFLKKLFFFFFRPRKLSKNLIFNLPASTLMKMEGEGVNI